MMFLAVSCLLSLNGDFVTGESKNPKTLVETIRRQLMTNNYDYPSEREDQFPTVRRARDDADDYTEELPSSYDSISKFTDTKNGNNLPQNDVLVQRAQEYVGDNNNHSKDDAVSKNDLLYYLDDEKLRREKEADGYNISDVSLYSDMYYDSNATDEWSPKVKYKIMKVKDAHPSRRSLTFRRFVKEESADGIALTKLDDQPLPQFRLPPERRQYMHDAQDNESGQEESSPPALKDVEEIRKV